MKDNLPDINFKEKKEKKGGALGWLRGRLGLGSRGAMGEAGITPSAMNAGRAAFGAGKFGASSGIAGLLAGKAGMLVTAAVIAVGAGVYLANQAPAPNIGTSSFSGGKVQDNYVPAILRSQAANQGSSLDMFKDTNRNAGLAMEEDPSKSKKAKPEDGAPASAEEAAADGQPVPEQGNMAQEMMGKLQGGDIGSLTSSMGGGSNKFSQMGGFGNKFNQGATGGKSGFTSGIGSGFQGMPKFDQRKGKMLAMKASAKPVFTGGKAGKKSKFGSGAFGQAKGMRATQKSYSGKEIDQMAGTQNKAWEGSTPEGGADGGAGLGEGGAGVMSSPSLDNASGGGGGGGMETPDDPAVPEATPTDVSPWASLASQSMMLILLAAVLAALGAYLINAGNTPATFYLKVIGYILCGIAMLLGLMALMNGIKIMGMGQAMLGTVYVIGGGVAMAAAGVAMMGDMSDALMTNVLWMAAAAGVIGLMGSMLGGK